MFKWFQYPEQLHSTVRKEAQEQDSSTRWWEGMIALKNPPLIYHYIFSKQVFASCNCMYDVCVCSPLCVLPLAVSPCLLSCSFTRAAHDRRVRSLWCCSCSRFLPFGSFSSSGFPRDLIVTDGVWIKSTETEMNWTGTARNSWGRGC